MSGRAAIVAMAQTRFEPKKGSERVQEMLWEVVKEVREQTGLDYHKPGHIDNAVTCSDDFFDARTISDACAGDIVGAQMSGEEKVSQDGLQALFYAAACVLSGHSEITIVAAHSKESQSASRNMITHAAFDPIFQRGVGLDYLNAAALQARSYLHHSGSSEEQCAAAVVRDRRHAAKNSKAQERQPVTVEQVMGSRYLCDPLKDLDVYPVSDGAIAMIVTTEERAKKITRKPVCIEGAGNCYNSFYLGDRALRDDAALREAARKAYRMAGIKDAAKDLDLIEIAAQYSYQELLWLECLGLFPDGTAGKRIEAGDTDLGGVMPVNVSGGMLSGNPLMLGGLARAAECFLQLRGEAGPRQVAGIKRALAQGATGPAAQHHSVMVFSA
ncbi:MAG TPA: thiolase family protein [bacterium]|nr:thiolase family protein [bacterium]